MPLLLHPFFFGGQSGGAGGGGGGGISFVAASSGSAVDLPAANDLNITKPAGTVQNEFICAYVVSAHGAFAAHTIDFPPGWTKSFEGEDVVSDGGGRWTHAFGWKIAGASEPATYPFGTEINQVTLSVGMLTYRGVSTVAPIDVIGTRLDPTLATTAITLSGVTTTVANTRLLACCGLELFSVDRTLGNPGGMTQRVERIELGATNDEDQKLRICDEVIASAGATGDRTYTQGDAVHRMGVLIALAPS